MKFKYLSISGTEIEFETFKSEESVVSDFEENGIVVSRTPLVSINDKPYWNENTDWGKFTKDEWIKKVCPKLRKVYG